MHPRVEYRFKYQKITTDLMIWTDSDHAGCKRTRKSTSGGVIMFGSHVLKSWSSTQAVISLSSGEAEYYSMVKGASVGLGIHTMMREIGIIVHPTIKCDASAAIGIVHRKAWATYAALTSRNYGYNKKLLPE